MLTKEFMQKLKEDELSRQVIIPLLQAMGYRDVFYYHGGSGEQGKDVVCWTQDNLQTRENLALVIKATTISGQAKVGRGTAGEVAAQIQQVFGSEYPDPITAEPQIAHDCWVVSNQKIPKEAEAAIRSMIKASNYDRHVRFVNGDKLWELVETHLASQTLMGKFQMMQKELSGIDKHYQPVVQVSADEIQVGLKEKYRGAAQEKPLSLGFTFQFPATPEGQAAKDALNRHIATGAPVSISSEFIYSIEYPEVLQALLGPIPLASTTLEISPLSSGRHFIANIEVDCDDGDRFRLEHVDLAVRQSGTEEATLENIEAGSLIHIKLVVNLVERSAKLSFGWQLLDPHYSCAQLLELTEFQNCCSKPFDMKILSREHGVVMFAQRSEIGLLDSPSQFYLEMLSVLSALQRKSSTPVMIPIRELTEEEIKDVGRLIRIVRDGRITGKWTEFRVTLKDFAQEAFSALSEHPLLFRLEASEIERIFGAELPLGVAELVLRNAVIANLEDIRAAYNSGERDVAMHIVALNGEGEFEKIYRDFLKRGNRDPALTA